jgi:hypothetical protein
MDDIERHAALIDAGWRVGVDGKWISPDPNHARFAFGSMDAAWGAHHEQGNSVRLDHVVIPDAIARECRRRVPTGCAASGDQA